MRALIVLALLANVAHADDYERRFVEGNELFDQGKWRESRAAYEAAYKLDARPIALFNIAGTYYKEGDLVNARLFYARYLDASESNEPSVDHKARERIEEIDRALAARVPEPPRPALLAAYPREVIRRPLTQPRAMLATAAGAAVATYETADTDGAVTTRARAFALAGATYGITDRIDAGAEVALALDAASRGTAFAFATVTVANGVALRGSGGLGFGGSVVGRLGVQVRARVAPRFAIVVDDDHLVLDAEREVFLRLPIGVGVQATSALFVALGMRLVDVAVRDGSAAYVSHGSATVEIAVARALDVVLDARVSDERTEASAFVRVRI